jgi:hypothetical protein
MKKLLLFTTVLISANLLHAQTFSWAGSLGSGSNEEGRSIATDANGNVYTTGSLTGSGDFDPGPGTLTLTSAGSTDVFITKLDAAGNLVWAIRMGGTGPQSAADLALDNAGNIYITGNFNNTIDMDPGPGVVNITSLGAQDIFIAKYDPSGNHVWSKRFGSIYHEASSSVTVDATGNVLTCGLFTGTTDFDPGTGTANLIAATTSDGYISKLDANGNYIWAKQVALGGSNTASALVCDPSGNVFLTGYYEGTVDFDPGAGSYPITSAGLIDIFTLKLLSNGDFSWAGSMGGTAADYGRSIAIDANGEVMITGEFQGTADLDPTVGVSNHTAVAVKDAFVSKFNPATASFTWAVRFGDVYNDMGYGITTDASNNIYLCGNFTGTVDFDPGAGNVSLSSIGNQRDCFILKLDASGNYLWAGVFGSNALGDDCYAIYVDAAASVYTTGYYQGTVDFDPGPGTSNLTSGGQTDAFVHKIQQCAPPAAPANTTSQQASTVCGSGSATLTATGTGTLGWYDAASGGTYLGGGTSYTTPAITATTIYYVQDSTCAAGPRTAVTVTFSPAMSTSVSSQTNILCNGWNNGSAGVSVSGGTPSYSYLWAPSGGTSPAAFNLSAITYTCTVTDAAGCTQAQLVTITEPPPIDNTITVAGNTITANQSGATYQWIDCLNSNAPVNGETGQVFLPQYNSDFAVIITMGACSDTSSCTSIITGIAQTAGLPFTVSPNPSSGQVTLQLPQAMNDASFDVFNATGQLVLRVIPAGVITTVELPDATGIYLIRFTAPGISGLSRVIKK